MRAALDADLTWIEIDVRVTADGAVVLLHDDTLERLWGDARAIADVPLVEVLELGGGERRIHSWRTCCRRCAAPIARS